MTPNKRKVTERAIENLEAITKKIEKGREQHEKNLIEEVRKPYMDSDRKQTIEQLTNSISSETRCIEYIEATITKMRYKLNEEKLKKYLNP